MILIFHNRWENNELNLFDSNYLDQTTCFSCKELLEGRWEIDYQQFEKSIFEIRDKVYSVQDIDGLISLAAYVLPEELIQIDQEDKNYCAAELNAFLTYLFTRLDCNKLNNPSVTSHLGPFFKPEAWIIKASKSGFKTLNYVADCEGDFYEEKIADIEIQNVQIIGESTLSKPVESDLCTLIDNFRVEAGLNYVQIFYYKKQDDYYFVNANTKMDTSDHQFNNQVFHYLNQKR